MEKQVKVEVPKSVQEDNGFQAIAINHGSTSRNLKKKLFVKVNGSGSKQQAIWKTSDNPIGDPVTWKKGLRYFWW